MGVPFPDIEPYKVLGVERESTPIEIKKAYKKLCLKYHPDKLRQQQEQTPGVIKNSDKEDENETFSKIQFSYSILGSNASRSKYDQTGWLGSGDNDDEDGEGFNWKEYFDQTVQKINIDMIEEDRKKYKGSIEEKEDIYENFFYYEGDFLKLFEVIPHLEFTEEEEDRVFSIVENFLSSEEDQQTQLLTKTWNKYVKSRKTKVKNMLKKLNKEAKEAEELEKIITKGKKKLKNEDDLKSLIQSRQSGRLDSLIEKLELKYGGSKKPKKRKRDAGAPEIDDEEFERIQAEMLK